eukprot:TRINITY_DN23210_c0_g1_i1.p2 TRINITY_DN23210_c0_g1~~TRINITY_DN23210_c0_g1_i1.p2  ORF type:complete len:115 (-),score=1.01 TRINITY_DN23210_c0_g1_i1:377-721(-)
MQDVRWRTGDSGDCIVFWDGTGRIVTYTARGEQLTAFRCAGRPTDVMISADGIFAINSLHCVRFESTLVFLSGDGRVLRCDRRRVLGGLRFVGWTDLFLLVEDWNCAGPLRWLR